MASDFAFNNSIDNVKGLAILLVVLGHIASPLSIVIFSFHIPLFFFLGGMFIKHAYSISVFLQKNFVRLIIPFFIFGVLGLVVNDIKNLLLHRPQEDFVQSITGLLFWMDMPHLQHYGFVLWFLPALFWARILSFCLTKYLKINEWLIFMLCVMGSYFFSNSSFTLPFGLDKGLVAVPWVFMGSVYYRHRVKLLALPVWTLAPPALLVLLIAYFYGMPRLDMATNNVDHIFLTLLYTFSLIFLIVNLTHRVSLSKYEPPKIFSANISRFGTQSMLVYVIHPYTNNAAHLLSTYFLGDGYWYIKFALTVAMLMAIIRIKFNNQDSPLFKFL
jgi:fucose 4-O-acetylase-like acetyltransferase